MVAIGGQSSGRPGVRKSPPFAKNTKDGAPSFFLPPGFLAPGRRPFLLDGIVGGLASDHDVVDVAFAEAGATDAYEARFLQELGNRGAAAVAHARLQSANHLMDDHGDGAAVGNASLNSLGDEFSQ